MMTTVIFAIPMSAEDEGKDWTVLLYNDGDNNLESYALTSLAQLVSVGSDDNVNFVVLTDTYSGVADLQYVEKDTLVSVGQDYGYPKEVNMASGDVLEEFIEIGVADFPAANYAVILWDHGGGWRGICWDDTTFEETGVDDFISMVEMRDAFQGAFDTTGVIIDVVGLDACLMAMPEVSYQLVGLADYAVFSEETISALSFPYDMIAADLLACSDMDGKEFAVCIAEDYAEFYSGLTGFYDWTISVCNTEHMGELKDAVDYFGTELLAGIREYMNFYQQDQTMADRYYYPYNCDLKGFADNIQADARIDDQGIKDAAREVGLAVDACVDACFNGRHDVDSTGLAIYLPSTNGGMRSMKTAYAEIPFAIETSWYDFTAVYSAFYGRTWMGEKAK